MNCNTTQTKAKLYLNFFFISKLLYTSVLEIIEWEPVGAAGRGWKSGPSRDPSPRRETGPRTQFCPTPLTGTPPFPASRGVNTNMYVTNSMYTCFTSPAFHLSCSQADYFWIPNDQLPRYEMFIVHIITLPDYWKFSLWTCLWPWRRRRRSRLAARFWNTSGWGWWRSSCLDTPHPLPSWSCNKPGRLC